MQASESNSKKKYLIPIVAVVGAGLVLILSNRPGRMANGIAVIENDSQYNYMLEKVAKSTQTAVGKFNNGIDLDQADKDAALEGAKAFDAMDAFRPDMAAGYFAAGMFYYLSGDTDSALNRLNQSLADAPLPGNVKMAGDQSKVNAVVADCHHLLSLIAFDRHDYKAAESEANQALIHVKDRVNYYVARAQAEVQLNKVPAAKKDLASALKLNPSYYPAQRLNAFLKH